MSQHANCVLFANIVFYRSEVRLLFWVAAIVECHVIHYFNCQVRPLFAKFKLTSTFFRVDQKVELLIGVWIYLVLTNI